MLFSTSNTILLTALVLNAASTFGAPIPYGKGNPESVTRRASSSGSDHESRYLDILVPKKRLNKMRRAARENALKALRSAEVHIARLAQVEDNLDLRGLEDDDVLVGRSHASSGATGASGVDAIQELLQQVEQQVNNLLSPSGGMCSCSMQSQCPNPGIPQPCGPGAAPCPGQPGSGGSGPGSGSDPSSGGGMDNSTSTEDPGLPTGLPGGGGLNATSTADPSLPTDIGGGGSGIGGGGTTTDPSLNSTETGIPGGDGGDGGASPTDSSEGSIPTGISGIGNDTSSDDGTGGGASATGLSGAGNSTSSDDGGDGGSLASATDSSDGSSATAPAGAAGDAPVGRSLFERWLSGRAPAPREPVRRVNSARFRLP